jgi:hypothetical protein
MYLYMNKMCHDVDSVLLDGGNAAYVSELHATSIFRQHTSEMSATSPTFTWCNHPRTGSTSLTKHRESLKSVNQTISKNIMPLICDKLTRDN